jgi:hypothetical protein
MQGCKDSKLTKRKSTRERDQADQDLSDISDLILTTPHGGGERWCGFSFLLIRFHIVSANIYLLHME